MKRVTVLLSAYNGEKYIQEQLNSLYEQKGVDTFLYIRDDGSSDSTREILRAQEKGDSEVVFGDNLGFCKSFWNLIMTAPDSDYYALCDQDDFWLPDKLFRAVSMLEEEDDKDIPLLYTSNVIPVDKDLKRLEMAAFHVDGVFSYAMSLRRPALPGCTFVFNKKMIECLKKYDGYLYFHDWLIYCIAAGIGKVVYDPVSRILYRQHGQNALGVDSGIEKIKHRFERFFNPKVKRVKSKVAEGILKSYKEELSPDNRRLTEAFAFYYSNVKYLLTLMEFKEYRSPVFIIQLLLKKI